MINGRFTIKQFGEQFGVSYGIASGFINFCVHLGLVEEAGEAEKAPGHKGKAAGMFRFADGELGQRVTKILADVKNAAVHQEK